MDGVNIRKGILFFVCLFLCLNVIWASENVSLELFSDKSVYRVGEDVNLTLKIENLNDELIHGQISGKIVIGDVGYDIQCFDYNSKNKNVEYLGLSPLPASLSNSNRKTMSSIYACSGTQVQSTKTIMDNKPLSQGEEETFELGPFSYSFNLDGKDYVVNSNVLNITVVSQKNQSQGKEEQQSQEQGEKQDNENGDNGASEDEQGSQDQNSQGGSQQNSNSENSQQNSGSQSSASGQNSQQVLDSKGQQALANNQQNAQSVNQLKKDIADAKSNPLDTQIPTEEKMSFWLWFFVFFVVLLLIFLLYLKYFRKEEVVSKVVAKKPEIPKYFKLLNKVNSVESEKERAVLLSQAIREYVAHKNSLDIDLTHSKAIEFTKSKLFIDVLKKTEGIEFAGKKVNLDYNKLVKQVRGEMR